MFVLCCLYMCMSVSVCVCVCLLLSEGHREEGSKM